MEENETPHPDYLKGYNEGYMITKYLPELANKLPPSLGESLRGKGFADGKEQFFSEEKEKRYPEWLQSDRLSRLGKSDGKEKGKNKEDIEIDK